MTEHYLVLPGNPIPQPRPRLTTINGMARAYNPKAREQALAKKILAKQWDGDIIDGPIEIEIVFYMQIPASISAKKKKKLQGQPHCKKPDIDNLLKFCLDCLTGIVYTDDALICEALTKKNYAENARTEIKITRPT